MSLASLNLNPLGNAEGMKLVHKYYRHLIYSMVNSPSGLGEEMGAT